jgi:putative nucleotidyltransferase with HDIG domain
MAAEKTDKHPILAASPAFKMYYFAVLVVGLGLTLHAFRSAIITDWLGLVAWTVFLIVADLTKIHLPRYGASISVSSALDFAAIVLFGPAAAAVMEAVVIFVSEFIILRVPLYKVVFDISAIVTAVMAAGSLYLLVGGEATPDLAILLFPMIICGITFFIVNTASVSTVIGLFQRVSPWRVWQTNHMWTITHLVAFVPLAALIVIVRLETSIWGVILFLIPLVLARYSFKLYVDMREAHIDTVEALTAAIDASDPFTHGHSRRVSELSGMIARELGMSEAKVELIEYAGLLHDIGKIAIQHDILLKPGPLTEAQWSAIRSHPETGSSIVSDIKFLHRASDIILSHHERMDGSGYPRGLCGDAIEMGARIMNVADAFDAMTSDRPYRRRMTIEETLDELERCAGSQFDTEVVRCLVRLHEQGKIKVGLSEERPPAAEAAGG